MLEQPQQQARVDASPTASPSRAPRAGVKPIVVSTERPSRTAASDAPAPRWQSRPTPRAGQLRRAPRRVGVREAVEAVAAHAPALAPLARQRVRRRRRRRASRGRRCRSTRRPARPGSAREHGVQRGERLRLVQRREVGRAPAARATTPSSTRTGRRGSARRRGRSGARRRRRVPSAADRRPQRVLVDLRARRVDVGARRRPSSPASSTRSLRLLDPALTTRTRTRRDQPPGQHPVAHVGRSSPCSRV